jgi:hypothetical protein
MGASRLLSLATCSTSHTQTAEEIELGLTMKTTASASRMKPSSSRCQSSSLGRSRISILGSMPRASSAATTFSGTRDPYGSKQSKLMPPRAS